MPKTGKHLYGYAIAIPQSFAALTGSNVAEYSFWRAPFKCKIVGCFVIPDSAVTGADTNSFGLRFKNKGAVGTGTAVVATKTYTAGVDIVAYDGDSLGSVSNNKLNEGDTVTFEKFITNSGANMPALTAIIEVVRN